jgi:UDP-N-acetyl-D-galactosamine dehydrogenase
VHKEYGLNLVKIPANDYDAVVITVPHQDYLALGEDYFTSIT